MNKETLIEYFISYLPTLKVLSVNCKNVHKNKDMAITLEKWKWFLTEETNISSVGTIFDLYLVLALCKNIGI